MAYLPEWCESGKSYGCFHAGEQGQLPDIQKPFLAKQIFVMPGNGGNSPISKCRPVYSNRFPKKMQWKIKKIAGTVRWKMQPQAVLHGCKEESETFCTALMLLYGPCTRMKRIETLESWQISHGEIPRLCIRFHAKRMNHWRPCGSRKKVRLHSLVSHFWTL